MPYYRITLKASACLDQTSELLNQKGFTLLYTETIPSKTIGKPEIQSIYATLPEGINPEKMLTLFSEVAAYEQTLFEEINWNDQWGLGKDNTSILIDLSEWSHDNSPSIMMTPGPGFGDLSHPTTRLVMKLMAPHLQEASIIDLGCGSGILGFAALELGASFVYGIDIDPAALLHAETNCRLNHREKQCAFMLPIQFIFSPHLRPLLLMNMISSEQEEAWKSLPCLHLLPMVCITSGILKTEEKNYLESCRAKGWKQLETSYDGIWAGYRFICNGN